MTRPRLGFYSPFLTAAQKAALGRLEQALTEDDEGAVASAMEDFLDLAFEVTRAAVLEFWTALDVHTFEEIRDDEEDSDVADQLRQLLWNGDRLSPFANRLLAWNEGRLASVEAMTVTELNNYLGASVDFYEGLRPVCPSGELNVPTLNLLEPPPPSSLELPAVVEAIESAEDSGEEAEPLTMIELVWEPRSESHLEMPPAVINESPAALKLLWEHGPLTEPVPMSPSCSVPQDDVELREGESEEELKVLILGGPPEVDWSTKKRHAPEKAALDVEPEPEPEPEPEQEPSFEEEPEEELALDVEPEPPRAEMVAPKATEDSGDDELPTRGTGKPASDPVEPGVEVIGLSSAPLSPHEERSQIIIKKKYLGYGKNSDGVMGYCGQMTLSRFDDAVISARLECSNPLLFLSPTTATGKAPVVTYWMPPAAFPQPGGHLTINTSEQNKVLSVVSLFPQSRTDFLSASQVLLLMYAPSILGLLYFTFVYLLSASGIVAQVKEVFPEAYAAALAGSMTADFRAQGVGLYQLEVVPASESLQLIWAGLIWLCPLIATKFFRHLSRSRQRELGAALAGALVLPSIGLLLIWNAQKVSFPLFAHADFAPLDLRYFLPWGVPLNLAVTTYLFLSVHGVWDRRVRSGELRFLLPVVMTLLYAAITFVLIFGRSWLT